MTPEQEQMLVLIENILSAGPITIRNIDCFKSKEDMRRFRDSYNKWLRENVINQLSNLEKTLK